MLTRVTSAAPLAARECGENAKGAKAMYANLRVQTIARPLFLTSLLVATLLVGGAGGYALATSRAFPVTPQGASDQAQGPRSNEIASLSATERQGSSENPNATLTIAANNASFLATEHQGSAESPDAVATSAPGNITFLASEHQGSRENPDASK